MAFNDLAFTPGSDNLAGIATKIWACPIADIASYPALSAVDSLMLAAGNITCESGKKFWEIYLTDETGKVESKSIGPRDGKARETMLTFRYPKYTKAVSEFIRKWQNTPALVVYQSKADGKLYVMGVTNFDNTGTVTSLNIPAYFEQADSSTGEKVADEHGTLFGWKYSSGHDPLEYQGTVPVVAAP